MYAIIQDSGSQIQVSEGEMFLVDLRDVEKGQEITFDQVLALRTDRDLKTGKPYVAGAAVVAEVLGEAKGDKLYPAKFRRRKASRSRTGHRQGYTKVRVREIRHGA